MFIVIMAQTLRDLDDVKTFPALDAALDSKIDHKLSAPTTEEKKTNEETHSYIDVSNDSSLHKGFRSKQSHKNGRQAIGVSSTKSDIRKVFLCSNAFFVLQVNILLFVIRIGNRRQVVFFRD